jgi:HigB_toxin, RelE-like toxic component of a toxin-antitoxin system
VVEQWAETFSFWRKNGTAEANRGRKLPTWTIESIPQGLYLKGIQETDNGVNKFMIVCTPGDSTMFLYAIFDGGNNAAREYFIQPRGSQYQAWLNIVTQANWRNPEDVKASYPKVSILKAGRVVFSHG